MFGKLFVSMYDGTLATRGPWQAMVTFQQLIVLADRTGIVDMTAEAIARRTTIPLDIIRIGITALEQADPDSRSPDENGRRIVRLNPDRDWGWKIVNHAHYRAMRSQDERREYMANLMRERRSQQKAALADVSNVSPCSKQYAVSSMQEASGVVDSSISSSTNKAKTLKTPFVLPDWIPQEHWDAWIEARTKRRNPPTDYAKRLAVAKLTNLREQGYPPVQVLMQSAFNGWSGLFPTTPPREAK